MSPPDSKAAEAAEKFARIETAVLDPRCTPLMLAVLVTLSNYANRKRVAWPSYETLAFITGGAIQNVRIAVERLEALGYIIVERDDQPGRSRVNHYHLQAPRSAAPIQALRKALDDHREAEKQARQRAHSGSEKQARARSKQARVHALTGILACPDPLEPSLEVDPSSDPNGSADAHASASHSREWKGAKGEPLPAGYPDAEAMDEASVWAGVAGATLDLKAVREAFRRHHYSVRCLLTDWPRSWEMWVDSEIDAAKGEAA